MTNVRKTSNVLPFGKTGTSSIGSKGKESNTASSPFAVNPTDTLKSLTDRRSKPLTEEQRLALLQRALQDFSAEARSHLPSDVGEIEKRVKKKMMEEGFTDVVATEAGEETVDILLENRRVQRRSKKQS